MKDETFLYGLVPIRQTLPWFLFEGAALGADVDNATGKAKIT